MRIRERGEGDATTVLDVPGSAMQTISDIRGYYMKYKVAGTAMLFQQFLDTTIAEGSDYTWGPASNGYQTLQFIPQVSGGYVTSNFSAKIMSALGRAGLTMLPPVASTPKTVLVSREIEIMTDVVTPQFHKRIAAGEIINNTMSQNYQYLSHTPIARRRATAIYLSRPAYEVVNADKTKQSYIWGEYMYQTSGVAIAFNNAMTPKHLSDGSVETKEAIAAAYEKLQAAELDVALMVAEGKETLNYIKVLLQRMLRLIRLASNRKTLAMVAKKTWRRLRRLKRDYAWEAAGIAEAWLEVRYALRPLMYDIADAMKYFTAEDSGKQHRFTFRHKAQSDRVETQTTFPDGMTLKLQVQTTVTARAGVMATKQLDSKWADLGFLNLAGVVWEKVKFSFIVDWIINISGLLYELNPTASWKEETAWVKTTISTLFSGTLECETSSGLIKCPIVGISRKVDRTPVVGPPLSFISVNLDGYKLLDLIALASDTRRHLATLRL